MRPARVLVFAKAPVPGRVKTRLIPALGEQGAADLAARMLDETLRQAVLAGIGPVELVGDPDPTGPDWSEIRVPVERSVQGGGDLGQRMAKAARRTLARSEHAVLIGTDCLELGARRIAEAAGLLADHDAAIIPATDGGYVLLALRRFDPVIFEGIVWSTRSVLETTLQRMRMIAWKFHVADPLPDVDEPADLVHLPASWLSRAAE
ncbi:TIGR04282 family arsenosugar biosynthesis glycosyltransferase [Sphingomonas sp. GCM10030256]|uniref:TIGR04282 family arsenosugar biosynthesis glycosyltransferase n=1 Tax=Sphingomonas sp. GCM10030256 TaxID=3273427 RepID=UPI003606E322